MDMSFNLIEIFTVVVEFLRPILAAVVIVAIIDVVLLVLAAIGVGSSFRNFGRALGSALGVGAVVFVISVILLPAATSAGFGDLSGALDYLSLIGASVGIGLGAAAACYPPIQFLLGMADELGQPARA